MATKKLKTNAAAAAAADELTAKFAVMKMAPVSNMVLPDKRKAALDATKMLLAEALATNDPTPLLGAPFPVTELVNGNVIQTPFGEFIKRLKNSGKKIHCITLQRAILDPIINYCMKEGVFRSTPLEGMAKASVRSIVFKVQLVFRDMDWFVALYYNITPDDGQPIEESGWYKLFHRPEVLSTIKEWAKVVQDASMANKEVKKEEKLNQIRDAVVMNGEFDAEHYAALVKDATSVGKKLTFMNEDGKEVVVKRVFNEDGVAYGVKIDDKLVYEDSSA